MTLALIFAAVWGALQLALVGSPTRTIRLRTALVGVAAGLYVSAPLAFAIQRIWIALWAGVTDRSIHEVTYLAGYTTDPAIEEVLKVLPLLAVLWLPKVRERWSCTDCVILGGAAGAGFMLAESLLWFGSVPNKAMADSTGWVMLTNIGYPTVTGFMSSLRAWLPPSVAMAEVLFPGRHGEPWLALHTAWSAIGGLGVALIVLTRGVVSRLAGVALLAYVSLDHAGINGLRELMPTVAAFLASLREWLPRLTMAALAAAVVVDWRRQRAPAADGAVTLAAERATSPAFLGLLDAANKRLPGSFFTVAAFLRLRRAYYTALRRGAADVDDLRTRLEALRTAIDDPPPRGSVARAGAGGAATGRIAVWSGALVAALPAILWFGVAGWPQTAGVLTTITTGPVWLFMRLAMLLGFAVLVRQLLAQLRAWSAMRSSGGEELAVFALQFGVACGGLALLGEALYGVFQGVTAMGYLFAHIAAGSGGASPGLVGATGGAAVIPALWGGGAPAWGAVPGFSTAAGGAMAGAAGGAVEGAAAGAGGIAAGAAAGTIAAAGAVVSAAGIIGAAMAADHATEVANRPDPDLVSPPGGLPPGPVHPDAPTIPAPGSGTPTLPAPPRNPAPDFPAGAPPAYPGDPTNPVIPGPPRLPGDLPALESTQGEEPAPQPPRFPPDFQHGAPTRPTPEDPHVAPDPRQPPPLPPSGHPYR